MRTSPARILVVDDDHDLRENLAEALLLEGYDVAVARDGTAALGRLAEEAFEAMLLDLVMPGIDGRAVLGRVRGDPRLARLPVIVTTGHTGSRARAGVPADAFLEKPFGVEDLLRALRAVGVGVTAVDDSAA